jgi:RimJ/RimL family protein N-acetyltransferase
MIDAAALPITLVIRAIEGSDAPALVQFHEALSPDSQRSRFFYLHPHLSAAEVEHFTCVDHLDREAVVVTDGPDIVAVGRYDRLPGSTTAEVAFVTADDHNGRGFASLLLARLAARARAVGVTQFVAQTLPDNRKMLGVFARSGLLAASAFHDGVVEVSMSLDADPTSS